jgi:hypothetical protein
VSSLSYDPLDYPATDFGLFLRLARDWDLAFLAEPLAVYRVHGATYTAEAAAVESYGYVQGPAMLRAIRDAKLRFLAEHGAGLSDRARLRRLAHRSARRQLVNRAGILTLPRRSRVRTARLLAGGLRLEPLLVVEPSAWRLLGASLLGPRLVEFLKTQRAASPSPQKEEGVVL